VYRQIVDVSREESKPTLVEIKTYCDNGLSDCERWGANGEKIDTKNGLPVRQPNREDIDVPERIQVSKMYHTQP
jgi:hypothetical protein